MRKRISRGLEPLPARSSWKRMLDRVVLGVGVLGPLASLPQVYQVYATQDASGLVAISWGAWAVMNLPWILYGFVHKETPIVMSYSLWFFINSAVGIGALMYGGALF